MQPCNWGDPNVPVNITCALFVFQRIIHWALIFSGTVAVVFVIWSGIRYITSGGDPKQVQAAKQTLTYAIIGLVLILSSFFIVNVIATLTGVNCIKTVGFDNCK